MHVMTFNLRYGTAEDGPNRWELRRDLLIECLRRYPFDAMGTQEGLPFQLEEIKAALPYLEYVGVGRYHGVETDRSHEWQAGEHCAIYYDARKWQVAKQGTFWLSDTSHVPASMSWGNDLPRIVTWSILQAYRAGSEFAVFNTHYHWGETVVQNSTALVLGKMRQIAGGLPTILMGDFNLLPDSPSYQAFTEQDGGGLADCWRACGRSEEGGETVHGFTGKGRGRIDWMFVSGHFETKNVERITFHRAERYPSDHFPVRAELCLRGLASTCAGA
jgi:endonuclease/exonuclease/phosphatase family metal-dependent hydrolase